MMIRILPNYDQITEWQTVNRKWTDFNRILTFSWRVSSWQISFNHSTDKYSFPWMSLDDFSCFSGDWAVKWLLDLFIDFWLKNTIRSSSLYTGTITCFNRIYVHQVSRAIDIFKTGLSAEFFLIPFNITICSTCLIFIQTSILSHWKLIIKWFRRIY